MKKAFLYLIGTAIVGACSAPPETKPVRQDIRELVFASGQVEWKESWNLVAETEGILRDLKLETSADVRAGQLLGRVENAQLTENLNAATQQVKLAEASMKPTESQIQENMIFAQQKYEQDKAQRERYERLYAKQSVSRQELENMRLAEENALAQWRVLQEQLAAVRLQNQQAVVNARNQQATSRIQAAYHELRAPKSGKVIAKQKFEGDFVRRGDVVATVADPNQLEIVLNVDESSIAKVQVGQTVYIRLNTEKDKVLTGTVREIVAAFDQETQSFVCKAVLNDSQLQLLHHTQLEGNIVVGEKKQALLVPRSLVGYGNRVQLKGRDEPVVIKTGIVSTEYVEVLEGLTETDILLPLKR